MSCWARRRLVGVDKRATPRRLDTCRRSRTLIRPPRRGWPICVGERHRVEILKALYLGASILILDEPTAVLTPQEIGSAIPDTGEAGDPGPVGHLHLPQAERGAGGQRSKSSFCAAASWWPSAAHRRHRNRSWRRSWWAGQFHRRRSSRRPPARSPCASTTFALRAPAQSLLDGVSLALRAGEILGIAGVAGNGQSALADLLSGLSAPAAGTAELFGAAVSDWRPRAVIDAGVGRISEDRHASGAIADMSVAENAIAEIHRQPQFFHHGFLDWPGARRFAQQIIDDYDVKCPSPAAPMRLSPAAICRN